MDDRLIKALGLRKVQMVFANDGWLFGYLIPDAAWNDGPLEPGYRAVRTQCNGHDAADLTTGYYIEDAVIMEFPAEVDYAYEVVSMREHQSRDL